MAQLLYSIRAFSIAMKMQQWIPFHFSPLTKYFVLLLTIISIKYYDCVFYYCLSYPALKSHLSVPYYKLIA